MSSRKESISLLKETNSGIQMGVSTLSEIISDVRSEGLRSVMSAAKSEHDRLGDEAHKMLLQYGSDTREPHPAAKAMSYVKTNVKMAAEPSDSTAAELVTDGCNMGIKTLNHYLNRYKNADTTAVDLTRRVIECEQRLCSDIREYL